MPHTMTARDDRHRHTIEQGEKHDARVRRREKAGDQAITAPTAKRTTCTYPHCDCAGSVGDCPEQPTTRVK